MASAVNGMGSSGLSSIYGNRTVISGLASGMDTEGLIQQAISGHKMKITGLQQKQTMLIWQQSAFRNIIDKMATFSDKYFSYVSGTNLLSGSFFNNAVTSIAQGAHADKVTVSGKTDSDVRILGVKQLATSATYRAEISGLGGSVNGDTVNLNDGVKTSKLSGTLSLTYGNDKLELTFDKDKVYKDQNEFLDDVKAQLKKEKYDDKIEAKLENGKITFTDKKNANNEIKITDSSGAIKDNLSPVKDAKELDLSAFKKPENFYSIDKTNGASLAGKEFKITIDGTTKTITLPKTDDTGSEIKYDTGEKVKKVLQDEIDKEFGSGKVTVTNSSTKDSELKLSFELKQDGSTMEITGGKVLGLSSDRAASYMNSETTLGDIFKDKGDAFWNGLPKMEAKGKVEEVKDKDGVVTHYKDEDGHRVKKADDGKYYRVDDEDEYLHDFVVNGKSVGAFSKNSAMDSVLSSINRSTEADVSISYSKTTNQFKFTAKESGANGKIEFGDGLAKELFEKKAVQSSIKKENGRDAIISMSVDGKKYDGISKTGNTFEVDGLTVTVNGTFGEYGAGNKLTDWDKAMNDAVTFKTEGQPDKVIDVVKEMVKELNEVLTEVNKAYATMPGKKTDGSRYEPLTQEQMDGMSETEIKNYEERAKEGILFGNRELSNLYNELGSAISMNGENGSLLRSVGIELTYDKNGAQIKFDEEKMRKVLESDPDRVKNIFTKSKKNGDSSDGFMQGVKNVLDRYASTKGKKGILVEYAGTVKSPATVHTNTMQGMIDDYTEQIDKWTAKMSNQTDYYTKQFTQLEQLIAQMNSQSQALMGMMGN